MPLMLTTSEDMCPYSTVCQANPNYTPNANSDLDSDNKTSINSAWAGIAVVIVAFVVGLGVWYAIRRRRRARGGHNSVDVGGGKKRVRMGRGFGAFWRRWLVAKPSEQPVAVGGDLELVEDEEAKRQRPSSSGSNLKRTTTSGTVETDSSHIPKLDASQKEADEEARLYPMTAVQHESAETTTSALQEPQPSHDASRTPRPSTPSSIRSSLSRLSIPPPGLGPPIHADAQSLLLTVPPPSQPPP